MRALHAEALDLVRTHRRTGIRIRPGSCVAEVIEKAHETFWQIPTHAKRLRWFLEMLAVEGAGDWEAAGRAMGRARGLLEDMDAKRSARTGSGTEAGP